MNRDTKHLEKKKKLTSQLIGTCKFPGKMMINENTRKLEKHLFWDPTGHGTVITMRFHLAVQS